MMLVTPRLAFAAMLPAAVAAVAELKKIVDTPALREQFAAQAIEFQWGDAADVSALVKKDFARSGEVTRNGKIRVDPL